MKPGSFQDPGLVGKLVRRIEESLPGELSLMEVCGTHTMAIGRHGIRSLLPPALRLLSGPGCPVCVTDARDIDRAVAIAREHPVTLATFGDMLRVPGSTGTLEEARARGADVRLVYSPAEAVDLAGANPGRPVLFLGVGFETTTPTVAAALLLAERRGLDNFYLLPLAKLVPPALAAILEAGEARVDGFILPGHVCAILGVEPFRFVAEEHRRPCVVTGFEPVDILQGVAMLCAQAAAGRAEVEIQYTRVVAPEGNPLARELVDRVFRPLGSRWREIGEIPDSGLALREEFAGRDGAAAFPVELPAPKPGRGCICGRILMGLALPADCPLFGQECTPAAPVGPCMVSSEGTCAAWFKYGGA